MPWNLDSSRPIYLQIIERVQMDIITGRYQPGDKLPSVRDLAQEAAVNPNTMQKALSKLERSGLIYSQRTSGRFITEDKELIHQMKKELAAAEVSAFVAHMKQLGITPEEIRQLLAETIEEEEKYTKIQYQMWKEISTAKMQNYEDGGVTSAVS